MNQTMIKTVSSKDFHLKGKRACIVGKRNKEKYMEYQDDYKKEYGIYPELDKINNPFTARWDDVYNACCAYRKSGFWGALYFHDLHNRFRRKLIKIYEAYSREWSFLVTMNLDHRSTLLDIPQLPVGKHIVNNLGYRKDENGNYYEGTWQNDRLIYGLVYIAAYKNFYIGSFDESGQSNCNGVSICFNHENIKNRQDQIQIGTFRFKNGALSFYESICLITMANIKNNELDSVDVYTGKFIDGYEEGIFLHKSFYDEIRIGWDKYRDGEVRTSMSSLEMLPRTLMMFYMLIWYLFKFVHCSVFFITPAYYISRKKNWRI